jgi:phytoene dehydrogenase-like protein
VAFPTLNPELVYLEPQGAFMQNYDVAVVGAGLGGLAAAALLSKRKIKTIVLERGATVDDANGVLNKGGITFIASSPPSYGFEHGGAFHELSEVLGAAQKVSVSSPCYQVALPDRRISVYPEWTDTLEELRREFPREIDALARFYRDLHKQAGLSAQNRVSSYLSKHRHAAGLLRKYRFSRELMLFFDVQSLFFFQEMAGDLSRASLKTLCATPPRDISGGVRKLAEQLHDIILKEGGEVRFNEPDSELEKNNNRVIGLKTAQGIVQADTILLNSARRRLSSVLLVGLQKEVIPSRMCRHVLFLPDYARPHDYVFLTLNAENDAASPPGMRTLCASFRSRQKIAFDKQTLISQVKMIIPFMDIYPVIADEHRFADREAAMPDGISFRRLWASERTSLLFRGSRKNVYLLSNEHVAPLQVMSAAHRFVRKVNGKLK